LGKERKAISHKVDREKKKNEISVSGKVITPVLNEWQINSY